MYKMLILFIAIVVAISPSFAQDMLFMAPADGIEAGQIRVAQLMPDVPLADVYINGVPSPIQALAFNDVSEWMEIPVGQYEIAFVPAGESYEQMLMSPITVTVEPETWLTIAATGSLETASLETQLINENLDTALIPNTARLTIFFDGEDISAVHVLANAEIIVTGMQAEGVAGSASLDMPAGTYTLQFVAADESQELIVSFEITLEAGTANLVTITGNPNEPQVLVEVTDMNELD